MPKIAIIVLHFGDKKNTLECLTSIEKSTYPKKQLAVFIVDNGTGNLSENELRSKSFLSKLVKLDYNSGFSKGVNAGIKTALKDPLIKYIFLLNNDIVLTANSFKYIATELESKNIDIAGGIITYYDDREKIWFAGGSLNEIFCFTKHLYMNKHLTSNIELPNADFITGAAMFIRRQVFEKIGFFDEDYFLYWEDVDFCQRAKRFKHKISCLNTIVGHHKVSSSSGLTGSNKLSPVRAYYFARNPFLFMKKNNLPILTGLIGQLFIRLPYYFFSQTGLSSFYQYLKGLWDGLKFLYLH
ncbi:hypothetical protein A3A46_04060 [Candidatus Roizmanbacteria bacterium RIFCSPLOWO2_01_FULL_37_13]|uniref:Glycosyltransferase 2-like domain-containing protein n=1 Tax=Candidatus Roizmanbacteria bacterium RIFCSPHIGHO2_02_FULL_38_11 TaxID=1802039 RepID=A0A1F7H0Z1_9BACT|nr:MAG: hypothetical protein A3C25_03380 [Candidatus Roizmanbacteria bacterium RIFCSPHIGHO2_02_FULL_38_11]OGK40952.1 MAG: hypothetical protein A3A46_04060 [Candidatus Roizmanbacteria bacterium RIFCSPLOWO2_01_FULL_37_13]